MEAQLPQISFLCRFGIPLVQICILWMRALIHHGKVKALEITIYFLFLPFNFTTTTTLSPAALCNARACLITFELIEQSYQPAPQQHQQQAPPPSHNYRAPGKVISPMVKELWRYVCFEVPRVKYRVLVATLLALPLDIHLGNCPVV